jgi:hypothetical protein
VVNPLRIPNRAVKQRVALNAVVRPIESEPACNFRRGHQRNENSVQAPQPTAPSIIPANIEEDSQPIKLSETESKS